MLPREFKAVSNPVTYQLATTPTTTTSPDSSSSSSSNGGKQATTATKRVGYMRLREFNSLAKAKVQEAIVDLEKQGRWVGGLVGGWGGREGGWVGG